MGFITKVPLPLGLRLFNDFNLVSCLWDLPWIVGHILSILFIETEATVIESGICSSSGELRSHEMGGELGGRPEIFQMEKNPQEPTGEGASNIEASGGQKASSGDGDDSSPGNHPSENTPLAFQQQREEPTGEHNKEAPPTPPSPGQPEQRSAAGEILLSGAKGLAKEVGVEVAKCLCQGGQKLLDTCTCCCGDSADSL